MKEIMGTAVNILFNETVDGDLAALAELILVYSEPRYSLDGAGQMQTHRDVAEFRIVIANAQTMRALSKWISEYADDMEKRDSAQGTGARRAETSEAQAPSRSDDGPVPRERDAP